MRISYGEMRRAAVDALRGLGLSFGQAEDAVETLLVTHAAFGQGYGLIRLEEAAHDPARPALRVQTGGGATAPEAGDAIDLHGATLFPRIERLADLIRARHAAGASQHLLEVTHTAGGWALPQLARRLAMAGLASRIEWVAPAAAGPDEAGSFLCLGGLPGLAPGQVLLADAPDLTQAPVTGLLRVFTGTSGAERPEGARMVDLDAALAGFIAGGLEVDQADHVQWFSTMAARVRLPTSERSRGQAG